jgi:hypothetical protein
MAAVCVSRPAVDRLIGDVAESNATSMNSKWMPIECPGGFLGDCDLMLPRDGPDPEPDRGRNAGCDLTLALPGVSDREAEAVAFGRSQFALVVKSPLILVCFRFGSGFAWSVVPYRWHALPQSDRYVTAVEGMDSTECAVVRVCATDRTGHVRASRNTQISLFMTRAWNASVRRHAGQSCSEARHRAALGQFFRRFTTPDELLAQAVATSVDGE